ncbi:MAG: GLPGLI family protein [Flavobacteriaceae bacterium]|jgi:GLPGLI family protein
MKNVVLFVVCNVLFFSAFAQETEGYLQFDIEVQAVDTTLKSKQQAGLLRNSKMEIFFSQEYSRVDFEMGELYKLSAVVNLETNRTISLMSGKIGKLATRTITVDSAAIKAAGPIESTLELLDDTKIILGYTCKKAILTTGGMESTYWYTNDIDVDISGQQITNPLIPGFPMEFYTVSEGVMMHFRASNLVFEIENEEEIFFTDIPLGYTLMKDVGK